MPKWAADLILEAITNRLESADFDRDTKDALVAAAKTIKRNTIDPPTSTNSSFDLFRLSKSKAVVDISPNTLRAYNKQGLPFSHRGKAIFASKSALAKFIVYAPYTGDPEQAP